MATAKKIPKPMVRAEIMRRIAKNLIERRKKLMKNAKTPSNIKNGRAKIQPLQNAFDRFSRGDPLTPTNKVLIRSVVQRK